MDSENFIKFKEITGEQDSEKILLSLQAHNFNIDRSIDNYFRELQKTQVSSELTLKRKIQETQSSITLGNFETNAFALSNIAHVHVGHRLTIRMPKHQPLLKGKRKDTPDYTVRFAMETNGFSAGKFPQTVSEFLYPLIIGGLIEVEAYVLEAPSSLSLLDSFKVDLHIALKPEALCDPSQPAEEIVGNKKASADEYFNQREALQKLFKLLKLEKTQTAMADNKREPLNDKGIVEESKGVEGLEKNLNLEDLGQSELQEMEPASSFRSKLFPYQSQALAWMYERETNCNANRNSSELHHLWEEYKTSDGNFIYFNHFTGQVSTNFPQAAALCKGGILADEMGLGKTVMVVALLHTNKRKFSHSPKKARFSEGGTLIIVPLSLMAQWHNEIDNHGTGLKVIEYYTEKTKSLKELSSADVVLTTYGIVQSDCAASGILFKMN